MWPFNRREKVVEQEIPEEINEYYQAERRERTGVAWLLALGTLVVTLLLAVGLFFGGRWVWRKVVKNDKPAQTAQTSNESQSNTNQDKPAESNNQNQPNSQNSNTPVSPTTPNNTAQNQTGTSSTSTSTPSGGASSGTANTPGTSVAGSQTAPLPDTGPTDTVAIFTVTAVAGTIAHRMVWTRGRKS